MKRVLVRQSVIAVSLVASLLGGLAPANAVVNDPGAPLVRVASCQVISGVLLPRRDEVGLAVRFENISPATLSSIVWRAKYGKISVDFIDDGVFSPNIQIDNYLATEEGHTWLNWLSVALAAAPIAAHGVPGVPTFSSSMALPTFVSTEEPENCSIVRATVLDGPTWVNPAVPQTFAFVPAPVRSSAPVPAPSRSAPIDVLRCSLSFEFHLTLQTGFVNDADRVADRIVVRTAYSSGHLDFTDEGTFAPGVTVLYQLKRPTPPELKRRSYTSLDDPADCAVVSVHYVDGSVWHNPFLDVDPGPLPTPVPNAIVPMTPSHWARHSVPVESPVPSPTPAAAPSSAVSS